MLLVLPLCAKSESLAHGLRQILEEVRSTQFPELRHHVIELRAFHSHAYFFKSGITLSSLLRHPSRRTYLVQYNARLSDGLPPGEALAAILAHELAHIQDYTKMGFFELAWFTLKYLVLDHSAYERKTDEVAMEKGFASGLRQYRKWLYEHTPPHIRIQKMHDYHTESSIDEWICQNPRTHE